MAFWFPSAPAERLAALRIAVGTFGCVYVLARIPAFVHIAGFAPERFRSAGVMFDAPLPDAMLAALVGVTLASGVAFTTGWRYRVCAPVYAASLLALLSYRNAWGMLFHTENLLVMHTLALAFAPAADAWVLGSPARARSESADYGWPIRLLQAVTVAAYFIAGVTKLRHAGWMWLEGDTLRDFVAYDNLRKAELGASFSPMGAALSRHGWLFAPLAAGSLVLELGSPLALVHDRLARLWSASMWCFHLGVLALMAIFFPYPLLGFAFAPFFPVERTFARTFARIRRARSR